MSDTIIIAGVVASALFVAFVFFVFVFRDAIRDRILGEALNSLSHETKILTSREIMVVDHSSQGWNKDRVGNLYSFASNLTAALLRSSDAEPENLRESIHHCLWHATQLSFGEGVENRLTHLCGVVDGYTPDDWNNRAQRSVIETELTSVWAATRYIVRGNEIPVIPGDDLQMES